MPNVIEKFEDLTQKISKSPWEFEDNSGVLRIVSAGQKDNSVAQFTTCPDGICNIYNFDNAIDNINFIVFMRNAFPEIASVIGIAELINSEGFSEESKTKLNIAISKLDNILP